MVITAGPTYEPIDSVRVIANVSTGLMGYELAREAVKKGYKTSLISGPTYLTPPRGAHFIPVLTAGDMDKAVRKEVRGADGLIMAAAVADFRPSKKIPGKIKKIKRLVLTLYQNKDIIKSLPQGTLKVRVGFALESGNLLRNAHKKLIDKKLDLIIANKISKKSTPFGGGSKDFILLERGKKPKFLYGVTKRTAARAILDTLKNSML